MNCKHFHILYVPQCLFVQPITAILPTALCVIFEIGAVPHLKGQQGMQIVV